MSREPYRAAAAEAPQDRIDPTRAASGVERWRKALGEANGEDPGASLDEPRRLLTMLKVFGSTRRLSDLCLTYPGYAAKTLLEGPSAVLAEAARDLSALAGAIGGAEALYSAMSPIKARADIAIGLAEIAQEWSVSEATAARSDLAERLVETALAWLVRSAVSRGELSVETDDGALEGLFVIGGGDFAHEDLAPFGPLDLLIVFDAEKILGRNDRMIDRAFVRLAAEFKEAFEGKPGDFPVFNVRTPMGSCVSGQGLVEASGNVTQAMKSQQNGALRRWLGAARIVAGDLTHGGAFLEDAESDIWDEQPIFTENARTELFKESEDPRVPFRACADILRWSLGRSRPVFRAASSADVFTIAAQSGVLAEDAAHRLIAGLDLTQAVVARTQLMKGIASTVCDTPDQKAALAALCGYGDETKLATVLAGAVIEAKNTLERLVNGAQMDAARYNTQERNPDDVDKLQDLGFQNGLGLSSLLDGWAELCSTAETSRFASIAPGLITAFGETQHPDEAARLFDQLLRTAGGRAQNVQAISNDESQRNGIADAFGAFGAVVEPLTTKPETAELFFAESRVDAPQSGEGFIKRFQPPRKADAETTASWRQDTMARIAYHAAYGDISFGVAADSLAEVQTTTLRLLFDAAILANKTSDLSLHVFDGPAYGLPGVSAALGFIRTDGEADVSEKTARAFLDSVDALGEGVFALAPDVSHRPGGVAGSLTPDLKEFKDYVRSEAVASDQIMLARGRVIAGPEDAALKALRSAVANPRRSDILFRDLDRARAQRMRRERAQSVWDFDNVEGGLYDVELIISTLIYRHAAAQPALQTGTPEEALDLMVRANLVTGDVAETLKTARAFWLRMMTARALARWSDPQREPVRKRFASLIARAAEVDNFSAVRPIMRGYADEVTRLYAQLVLGRPSLSLVANG